ncbi:MAG: hypothetical protein IT377_06270 [Polyangiaceae bacterium]|nr:hypothetical protein [Myxococcales bacterium]MCC6898559.1 hypothetical protein [Polyangiaceae bacterium]
MGTPAAQTPCSLDTPAARVELERDGIVVIHVKSGIDMTEDHMRLILEARFTLAPREAAVLVDARLARSVSRAALELSANPKVRPFTDCLAILNGSPVSVVLANFFLVFVRPPYPTKLFRDEEAARAWLRGNRRLVT